MRKHIKIILPLLLVVLSVIYAVNWAFFDIQRIDGQKLMKEVSSADGNCTVSAYLNDGGATTGYEVLCSVRNNKTNKEKNIYWNYHCTGAKVEWNSEDTVTINGIELNVNKDTYDYRND